MRLWEIPRKPPLLDSVAGYKGGLEVFRHNDVKWMMRIYAYSHVENMCRFTSSYCRGPNLPNIELAESDLAKPIIVDDQDNLNKPEIRWNGLNFTRVCFFLKFWSLNLILICLSLNKSRSSIFHKVLRYFYGYSKNISYTV